MQKNYEAFSTEEFLEDSFFIQWIRTGSPEAETFWSEWMSSAPANLKAMQDAELQLRTIFSLRRIQPLPGDAAGVWQGIQESLETPAGTIGGDTASASRRVAVTYFRWLAAAAVVLFAVAGIWFMRQGRDVEKPAKEMVAQAPDISPGGNRAVLTLADGRKLILDTTANGAVTKQGNVTVIKLNNGQLAYDKQEGATEVLYNKITTPRGGQYQLVLADGTRVWLNAASSLRFPTAFNGDERRVELTGEGYFEVAHDAKKPFHVQVNDMDVQVLGTHFNINSYADEPSVKTTLLEGRVKVKDGINYVFLNPGQQAIVAGKNQSVRIRNGVDLDEVVAWKNGRFEFNNTTIETVMRQLSRWYDVDIEYVGSRPDIHFVGSIARTENISEVLHMLEQTKAVRFQINQRKIQVMK